MAGLTQNYLSYESKTSEILATDDGSNLDAGCTLAYADEAKVKTWFMSGEITEALADSGCAGIVTSVTYAESFIAGGSQVHSIGCLGKKSFRLPKRIKLTV